MIVGLRTDGNEYVAQNAALRTETSHGRQLAILGSLSSDLSPQPAQVAPVFGSRPGRHSASRLGGTGRLLPSHLVGSGAQVLAFNPVPILLDPGDTQLVQGFAPPVGGARHQRQHRDARQQDDEGDDPEGLGHMCSPFHARSGLERVSWMGIGGSGTSLAFVRRSDDPASGPSPRIVDTVVVDYAAVGSVAARQAS